MPNLLVSKIEDDYISLTEDSFNFNSSQMVNSDDYSFSKIELEEGEDLVTTRRVKGEHVFTMKTPRASINSKLRAANNKTNMKAYQILGLPTSQLNNQKALKILGSKLI